MKIVGHSVPIHDAPGKVTGTTLYAGDMSLKGMLHACLITSSIPHGRVVQLDTSAALAMPGVVAVIDCFSLDSKKYSRFRTIRGQETPEQEQVFNRHVRFVGDKIGCVIAEDPDIARKAAAAVVVEYEHYPHALTIAETLAGAIDNVHAEGAVYGDLEIEVGSSEDIAPDSIATDTNTQIARINHVAMEPHVALANYDDAQGELTIWSPNQSVHGLRTVIGDIFSLPYHKVRVVKTTMGGSFGSKQEWIMEPVAAAAALHMKRPVRLVATREQCFISTIARAPMQFRMRSQIQPDGSIQSMECDVSMDAGGYLGNTQGYCFAMSNKFFRCYQYPHMKYRARAVITNTPVSGAFRGWTSPELNIAFEHNLNAAAHRLGLDPYQLRLHNAARPGDVDPRIQVPMGDVRLREALELGAQKFNWFAKRQEAEAFNLTSRRYRHGVGVACGGHLSGYYPKINDFAEVGMRMTEDGCVIVHASLHDHGCGTVTAFQMIVAEALGIGIERISVREADTAHTPFDYGCFSSRTTYVLGRATQDCALKLVERVLAVAAQVHELPAEDLYIADGFVRSKTDSAVNYSYADVSLASMSKLKREISEKVQYINESNPGVTGAHFAHVEVDCYTGMTRLLDYTAIHDIGQAINREICIAQIQGAVMMGAGAAISEDAGVDAKGVPVQSLKDYHLINLYEMPKITVDFIEAAGSAGPFGAKSIGEVSLVPVTAAVAGAMNHALESELSDLPITPDKIVALMRERKEQSGT